MRPFPQTMPSVRSRVTNAPQRPSWFAQAAVALLLLIGGATPGSASAAVALFCDLQANSPAYQSGASGSTLTFSFNVVGSCASADVNVAFSFDPNGTTITSPTTFTGATPGGSPYQITVQLGPTGGNAYFQATCASGCAATNNIAYFGASVPIVPDMTLTKAITGNTDPDGSGLISPGDVLTYTVTATNTGNVPLTFLRIDDPLIAPNTITCPTTAIGATCVLTGTYTVTATDLRNGFIDNVAQATANEFLCGLRTRGPAIISSCGKTFTATTHNKVDPPPMMTVSKQFLRNIDIDSSGTVTQGDVLIYAVSATNNGLGNLTNVTVSDPLLTPSTVTCLTVGPHSSCKLQGTYTVTGTDVGNGAVVNTGSATADHIPGATNSNTVTTPVFGSPAMTVSKALTANADGDHSGTVTQGDVLTYTVTATNTGNVTLTNVQVSDPLTIPNGATCASVAVGAACVLIGNYTVTATDVGNGAIANIGSATASQLGAPVTSALRTPVFATNTMTVSKVLSNNADNDGSGNVSVGDVLTFTVTATNTGNATLTNVQVSDPLTTPSTATCASVPVNGTCVLTGTYTVTAADARNGSISNTGSGIANQLNQLVNSTLNTPVAPLPTSNPALSVLKQLTNNADNDHSGNVSKGDVLTFTVTATNTGNVTLTNVQVTDPLTSPNSATCASVPVNGTCVLVGTYTVTQQDAQNGSIANTGSATASQVTVAVNSSVTTAVAPLPTPNPKLSVVKQLASYADNDHSNNVSAGDVLTFTVTATNTGNVPLTNVQVSDPLTTPSAISCASLAVNGTCVLTGTYTVTADDARNGSISNTGRATASETTTEATSSVTTTVAPPPTPRPALTVAKQLAGYADNDGSNSITAGDVLTFTVTATNTGNVNLDNVKVNDPLTTPNVKNCLALAPGESCVLTGTYTVAASDANAGSITNTGSATASQIEGAVNSTIQTPVSASPTQNFRIVILGGNGQSGAPGQPLAQDFVVAVTPFTLAAVNNRAIVNLGGVPVSWQILGGGGSLSNGGHTVTDTNGHSSNHFTLGPGTGQQQVQVCVPIESCVTFTVNSVAPNAALTIISGNGQSLIPGAASAPLVVHLSNNGSPVANAVIHWNGNNATLASATSTTNANGDATNTAKVQSPGAATVTASSTSPAAGPLSFSLNAAFVNIPGLTPQQSETANALDHACIALLALESLTPGQADLLRQCEDLAADGNPTEVKNALNELFANIAFLETSAALLIESTQFDNIKARIAALRSGTGHTHFGGLAFQTPDGTLPMGTLADSALGFADDKGKDKKDEVGSDFDRWGFFASGTFGWGSADPRQVTPGFGFHTNGLTAGVDYRYNDHLIFGMAGGYARYKADARAGMGGLDTSGWTLSAYTTLFKQDSWYMDGVFSWGNNNFDITRRIIYTLTTNAGTTTVDQTATGSSGGSTIAGALTFGRDFTKGPWSFGPYFRGTWTKVSFDDFHEKLNTGNGSGVGLFVQTQDLKSVASVLGGKVNYVMSEDWGVLMPHAEVEWNHEFHDNPDSITARFLNDPTHTPITVRGDPTDTDFFRLGIGLSFVLPKGRSGFIYYEKVLGRTGVTQDNLAVGIRIEF